MTAEILLLILALATFSILLILDIWTNRTHAKKETSTEKASDKGAPSAEQTRTGENMGDKDKLTSKKTALEFEFTELNGLVNDLESRLQKLDRLAGDALLMAEMSHSLIVVRKISDDKIEALKKLLD